MTDTPRSEYERTIETLVNRPGTNSIGMGACDLDIEMARAHGWTNEIIAQVWSGVTALVHAAHRQVAVARGHNYVCPNCECWTVAPPQKCHLCKADEERSRTRTKSAVRST